MGQGWPIISLLREWWPIFFILFFETVHCREHSEKVLKKSIGNFYFRGITLRHQARQIQKMLFNVQQVTGKQFGKFSSVVVSFSTGTCWNNTLLKFFGRCSGLMVSVLDSVANGPGSSFGLGHSVVFLGKTFCSHGASLHAPRCINGYQRI